MKSKPKLTSKTEMESLGVFIRLTKGYVAIIDPVDEHLALLRWAACYRRSKNGNVRVYAVRQFKRDGVYVRQFLHQAIFGETTGDVDHQDGDSLNCRRSNLRAASRTLNNANATKRIGTSSRWKGVFFHAQTGKWCTQICSHGVKRHVGLFREECELDQCPGLGDWFSNSQ